MFGQKGLAFMGRICDGDINLRIISESNAFKTTGLDEISSETHVDRQDWSPKPESRAG